VLRFAEIAAREAATLYDDRAWDRQRGRIHGIVFIGGLAELVAAWLSGDVDLDPDELAGVVADLFAALGRRPVS
jgi:hypothetical protein